MSGKDSRDRLDASTRRDQLDEIIAELMRTNDRGERVDRDQWLTRYPDFSKDLRKFFQKQDRLEAIVIPLREAAAHALNVRCPHCNNPIELLEDARLEEVSCPSCGSSFSLVGEKTISHYAPGEKMIGHFQLLDQVGIGAFGSVWKARDTQLDRTVAVKIPRNAQLDKSQTELFLRDARAAAQLKHPNIVGVHEVGKQDDTIYIVSDFIQGASLKEWADAKRITPSEAARLCVKIATALHHAHESGVIHRDLKPSNIMMDTDGEPHIVDFGLAKREAGEITMTVEGQVLGTPAYMSPEQARGEGHRVDRRADIYAMGVILFELLTGELPFRGDKQMLMVQILNDEPPSPRKLNSSVPRDIETICLKCLSREPAKRYQAATEFAEDLKRFGDGRMLSARPVGRVARGWRWCRRNPALAGFVAMATILLFTLGVGGTVVAWREKQQADRNHALAVGEARSRRTAEQLASEQKNLAVRERQARLDAEHQLARSEWFRYASQIKLAQHALVSGNVFASRNYLDSCRWDFRGWEHDYLHTLTLRTPALGRHVSAVLCVAYSPDGRRIASGSFDGVIKVWDARSGQELANLRGHEGCVRSVAFSHDGDAIVSGGDDHTVRLWSAIGESWTDVLRGHTGPVNSVAFHSDWLVVSGSDDGTVKLWDMIDGDEDDPRSFAGFTDRVLCVALGPDGKNIVGACADGTLMLWEVESSKSIMTFRGHTGGATTVVFNSNGQQIVSGGADNTLRIWNTKTGAEVRSLKGHTESVTTVAFSSNGERIVSGGKDKTARIWNPDTGENTFSVTRGTVNSVAFNGDGQRIVIGSDDNTVTLWTPNSGQKLSTLRPHNNVTYDVRDVAVSPDGQRIVSAGWDGIIKVSDALSGEVTLTLSGHTKRVSRVAFSPDGKRIVSAGGDATLRVWDAENGLEMLTISNHTASVADVAISPDGQRIVSGSWDKTVKVFDAHSGEEMLTLTGHTNAVICVAFSPDGQRIVSGSRDHTLKVWNVQSGQELLTLRGHTGWLECVAYSPDGTRIVSGANDRMAKVWDAINGQELLNLHGHTRRVTGVAFSPGGQRIVSVSLDKTIRLWDAETGHKTLTLNTEEQIWDVLFSPDGKQIVSANRRGPLGLYNATTVQEPLTIRNVDVNSVTFSPDGQKILAGGGLAINVFDATTGLRTMTLSGFFSEVTSVAFSPEKDMIAGGTVFGVRLWNVQTNPPSRVWRSPGGVGSIAFSPEGQRIVCGCRDGTLKLLDVRTGQMTLTFKAHSKDIASVAFSPDGRRIVSGSWDNTVKIFDAQSGEEMLTLTDHTSPVKCVAFSPDGQRIVSGSGDRTLKIWDVDSGNVLFTLKGHTGSIGGVAFSPDGRRIVSGSGDDSLKIWDALSGEELSTLKGNSLGFVSSVAFSPDGQRIVSGGYGTLNVWKMALVGNTEHKAP